MTWTQLIVVIVFAVLPQVIAQVWAVRKFEAFMEDLHSRSTAAAESTRIAAAAFRDASTSMMQRIEDKTGVQAEKTGHENRLYAPHP